ncbi:lysine-rich nucleolar protein 1 isoform 2-T2 [Phaethornis superciliosus]
MIIKKKRKAHEEPVQKKKKVKSSWSQTIIKIEEDVQTVIKTEVDGQLESQTKVRKKEDLEGDEHLDQFELKKKKKKKKKKTKKKKVVSELWELAHPNNFVNVKCHRDAEPQEELEKQIKTLKKNKRKLNNQRSDMDLSNHHTDENEFAFKKSRKNTALTLEMDSEVIKKKKKKEDMQDSEHKQSEQVCKKQHKCISQEKAFISENQETESIQNDGESNGRRKKRKKNKDKSDSFLLPLDNEHNMYGIPGSPTALSDFRKMQRMSSQEFTLSYREDEDTTANSGSIRETKKKKRNKDISFLTREDNADYSHRGPDKDFPAQQEVEEVEELSGKKGKKNIKDNNEVIKKKNKKKIQKKEEEITYSKVSVYIDSASKSEKITLLESNKKNKESEMKRAECVRGDTVDRVLCNSNHMLCDRKQKRRKKEVPQKFAEEPGSKGNKKKIKIEEMGGEEHVDDITIVQEKKGNCDEVSIDKDPNFGQWSTASFQSSEEKMKFLRLLGGFKKSSVPIENLAATTNKPTMALNREGEEKLQQALKMEFDKAMDLKQHRGIGLGFQPAANKKVYIDKYTTRSIKFED